MLGKILLNTAIRNRFINDGLSIGVIHAGGPAPGGNLVNLAAALRAQDHGLTIRAFKKGYKHLMNPKLEMDQIMTDPRTSILLDRETIRLLRSTDALRIKTDRANPSKPTKDIAIKSAADISDDSKAFALDRILDVFEQLRIGALISIGGDDTMKIANMLMLRKAVLEASGRVFLTFLGIVHVPKTIDNDYSGVPVTFGFDTAAEELGKIVEGFYKDAFATDAWHLVELMGRKSGALTIGAAIYSQATYAMIPEQFGSRRSVPLQEIVNDLTDVVLTRKQQGKDYGAIIYAEGMNDLIDFENESVPRDEHGHVRYAELQLEKVLRDRVVAEIERRTGKPIKMQPHKRGYEVRQANPNFNDRVLCEMLGYNAVDAILNGHFGNMISFEGYFNPILVPFSDVIDQQTLLVNNRAVDLNGGFYQTMLAMQQPFQVNVNL
jgi:6-phosphofructokinase 1